MIWLLLACGVGNTPPRFDSVNNEEVRHIFGLNFLVEPLTAHIGETLSIDLGITDLQRDSFRVLWPQAPPGWSWNENKTQGHWTPPSDWWEPWNSLTAIAIDSHGASDVLYFQIDVPEVEAWDTGLGSEFSYLVGEVNPETFEGEVGIYTVREWTECSWSWSTITLLGTADDCPECDRTWAFKAADGKQVAGDCSEEPLAQATLPTTHIGHEQPDTVLLRVDGEWLPLGAGNLKGDVFTFGILLP